MNFVHIGAEKTSTTYLQSLCRANRQALARQTGITYLSGPALASRVVAACRTGAPFAPGELGAAPDRNLLISEFFYRDLHTPDHVAAFRRILDDAMPDSRIVLYVRDQVDWLESFYSTYIKRGKSLPFDAYLDFLMNKKNRSLDYAARIAPWEATFGDRLAVYQFDGQSVLDEMLARFGARAEELDLSRQASSNSSLPPETLELLRGLNRALEDFDDTPARERTRKALKAALVNAPLGKGRLRATPDQRRRIVRHYAASNRRFNARWGTALPE